MIRLLAALALASPALADTPPLTVAANGRTLEAGGKPFFWLGDTAWELFHRDTRMWAHKLVQMAPFKGIVAITRGGLIPSSILARELGCAFFDGGPVSEINRVDCVHMTRRGCRSLAAALVEIIPGLCV